MGYQDFLQNYKQKRQQEPIELPEYDLPTQVDQIFGKPRPADKTIQAETNTSAPLEKPKKKKDILDTKLPENVPFETLRDVKDWSPNKPIQDLKQLGSALKARRQLHQPQPQKKRTVAAKTAQKPISYTPQTGKNNDQSEFLNQMDFRGPNEAEKAFSNVRESMGLQPSVPESRRRSFLDRYQQEEAQRSYQKSQGVLADIEAGSAQAAAERRISQPQNTVQTAKGADLSKSSLSAVTGQKEREAKTRLRRNRVDDIRGLTGGSTNTTNRMVGRALALVSGYAPDEIAEAIPPTGSLENAAAHLTGAAIRGATSIPEGVARFLEQNLVNRDAVQTYELMNQFADAEDKRAASEGRASKGDEYRKIAQGSLESQTHVGDYLEPLTKAGEKFSQAVLPTDPTVEGSINPLKQGFWENTLPEAAGSMAPFFAGGAAGAAVKIPRMLSAGVLGAGMEIPQGYHEARDAGATPEQLSRTIDTRTAAGALEMFGAESLLGKIGMKGKSIPGYLAKESFQEGVQETGQSATSDIGDKYYAGTKPNLAWSQIGHNALENAVPALFLGLGGGAMGVPAHLAERKANSAEVAQQIESLANAEPSHPVVQAIASLGIDPGTITQADERAVDELSIRLQSMAKMDSQIQQMQGQREVLAQQAQNVYDAQLMGRVPSSVDMQAAQQLPMVDQAVAELTQQKEAVTQDLTQNVSPLFRNLAKAVGSKQVEPLADVADDQQGNLLKEVRKVGGIIATEGQVEAGELEGLSPKESGTTGLISRSAERGELPDRMRERMVSEGLTTAETANQFIDEVQATTRQRKTKAESYADYQRSQMTEQELADSDLLDQHLADRATTFSRVWRTLDNPKTIFTPNLARDFVREAGKAGFSDEFIERSLVEFEAQRGVRRQGSESEESRGLRTDSSIDTGVSQSSMVDSERSINLSRRSAEPGIGVSMSPYKVLEANNKDLLKRLYDVNLNSEEGKAGIAQLRDYARKNDIEQHHVDAHISDIQNWQGKYGVPKNPDIQQPQATRTTKKSESEKEVISQPARTEAAPVSTPSGFSQDQKKLLGREPAELADDEFDEHLEAVEKLHADAVHGKVNLNEGQMSAVVKKIRQIKGERHQRVRAGRLKSLYGDRGAKQPSKTALAEEAKKAVGKERETGSVPRETENVSQAKGAIDEAAHEAATSPKNDLNEPTEAQKEAGNYQKGHIKLHGLDITIENPEGSTRSGKGADGKPWEVEMSAHYGYIRRTEGADEEQIDVYIGPKIDSNEVFVVDQVDAKTGEFDEHKVILGAETQAEAEELYDAHFDDGKGPDRRGAITQMPVDGFKDWLKSEDTALPVSEPLGEVDDTGKTEPSGEKAEKDGDAEVGQSPDGGLQVGSGGDVLQPIRRKNSVERIMGDIHSLEDVQRVGEVDFELWENEGKGGKTTIIRDAEIGEPIGTRYDPDGERATKRHQNDVQTARKREVSSDERSVDDGRLPESGLADKPGTGKPVAAKSEKPEGTAKSGSVVGKPAKSGKRRGLGKQATPSLFGDEAEQTTESSNSEHAQELVAEVAQETEPIAAGEAVIQAAVADLPEVAEEVQSEEPQPKPVKTPKPKSQPLATLTSASFTITPDIVDQIRSGGAVTKYKQNVDAIKTMRQVLLEGRRPTVEEQETMALYAGFGGIKDLFAATGNTYEDRKKWFDRQQELKELIGEEAYKAASASTKNAHYTDPHIVTAMWSMAERLGFTKGRVLEPSMGSGNFLGLIPSHLRDKATFTGVELDNTTGNIAKMLYPDANIHIQGFEDLKAPDGFFDLAIGNVPFGDYRISDNRYNKLLPQIHNYFFLKALDKVRPGGLVMFITSTGTMDSRRGEDIRKELAKQADLVSAMRFPAETFGKTALTSVVTDLIILRKRLPGETSKSDAWVKSSEVNDPRGAGYQKIKLNDYFAENPSQILGEFNGNNRMYPGRANVDRTEDFEQRLAEAMANLPAGVMSEYSSVRQPRMKEAGMKAKEGGYIVKDGQLLQSVSGGLAEIDATPDRIKRVDGMLKIRDAFDNLIDAEMGRAVGGPAQRKALNSAYDAFHAKYGPISDKKNREALEGDPDLYRLMALEDYDAKKKIAKKQPIFTKSTVSGIRADAKPSNVVEAVAKSFQMNGEIILSQLAEDLGLDERTIGEELVAKKIAFQTPNANWELAPHYLSGNVRRKLAEAKIAAATDDFYQANVDALEHLLPRDIRSDEISVEMGAPWMEPQVISQFVAELFEDDPSNVGVAYDRHLGTFTLSLDRSRARGSRLATTTWGTADLPFDKLLNLALTGKQASVFDEVRTNNGTERRFNAEKTQAANTKLDAIKQRFREWVWENDERKQKLLSKYNDLFNSHVPAEYNVEFLLDEKGEGVVPGLSSGWKLRKHQAAAVFRAVIEKRGLLAHEVGLGKTLAMIASASELKRLGIARKPAIAVPKKVLPGFVQAARSAFPLMKIHVIDSRDAVKRNTSMSQVATGEHDLVLMTHDNMDMLKMKPEFEAEILRGELDEVTAVYNAMRGEKTSDKRLLKQIENRKSKLEAKLQDALKAERKDDTISFEDTGIDFLFVDECFVYETEVVTDQGILPIGEIVEKKLRVRVLSCNRATQELEWKPVVRWLPKPLTGQLLRIKHEQGEFICTPTHQIWTKERGYVQAGQLTRNDKLLSMSKVLSGQSGAGREVQILQSSVQPNFSESGASKTGCSSDLRMVRQSVYETGQIHQSNQEGEISFLREEMFGGSAMGRPGNPRNDGCGDEEILDRREAFGNFRTNEAKQSDTQTGSSGEDQPSFVGQNFFGSWRKWTVDGAADVVRLGFAVASGVRHSNGRGERSLRMPAQSLQSGFGQSLNEDCDRSGRNLARFGEVEISRSAERERLIISRVVSVEVYQPANIDESSTGSRRYFTVYDLEVADNHNYFANGISVSNCHKYKSLPVVTALGQVKGVPTGDSQRAINMLMRARYLQQIQNGGGLIAATGTPVSNSLVEAWIMAKFLQPDLLEEAGVQSFDAWTRQFAETVPALEMGATGEWKQVSRLSKFKNLPELQTLARMTLDVKTAKETGILDVRPKRQDKVIQVPQDEAQAAFMQVLRERAAAVKAKFVEPYEDNYLVISSDGMQMASDPRLVLPGYKAEGGKIKALADNVLRIYKEKPGTTQMIFSDSGVAPNAWGFHLYGEIINKLVEGGIPADKIINFSKMDTDAKVAKAQDRLNSGDAVIAIGHRENMGTGINAQQKMAAIHQFDVPWKPALVEQSEARGWRQGNENKEIEILSYVTEGSFDAIKWSTVARKQQAITAFMQKPQDGQARELEDADDDALSYDQIAAAASGDGDYLRKAELDAKVFKLDMMERSHNSEALNRKQEIPRIVDRIAALNRRAAQMDLVAASAKEAKEKEFEYKTPKGEVVEDKKDAAKNLVSNYLFEKDRKERSVIGQYKGYRLMSDGYGSAYMELPIKGAEAEKVSFNVNTTEFIGTLQSLEKKVSALASNADADHLRETTIPNLEKDLENLRAVTDSPFPFTEQLTKAKRQLEAVNKRLKAKEAESASEGQPLSAGDTDVRAVSALGRKIRRHLREKEIKPSDIHGILERALPEIEAQLRDQKDVWREFQRRKAEEFLAEHEGDTGLAGMAITAQSASRTQAAYDPEIDAPESRPMASRRTRESVESSPEFKKWFGKSKVVDQSGKPLPLYHGTQARNEIEAVDPSRFLSGSHFGPGFYMAEEPEIASRGYAEGHLHPRGQEQSGSPSVYKLYARIENPLDMSKPADSKMIAAVFGSPNVDLEEMGFGSRPTNEVLYKQLAKRLGDDKRVANEKLQELGFDGITRLNRASDESPEHREWVVFDPRQVKSATGNQGTFDDSANLSTSRREVAGPASELANPMDVLLHAETITKSRGSRGVRMYVNDHARALLGASLTEVFGEDYSNVNAINLSREEIGKVADYLETEAKGLTGDYQAGATQFVAELRDLLAQGGNKQKTFNIVDITPFQERYSTGFRPDAERAVETFKGDVREESFHWSQREVGGTAIASVGSSWAQSSKGYGKYRKALLKLGYPDDPEIIAAETAAKIAAGKFDDLGIRTEADHQQADEWLASYFERIADKHGVDALAKFDRLLPKATEAKQKGELSAKERLRQAIKEEAATATGQRTDRPKPSGGSGQTVRSGNQEKREEGRAEPIPRRSAEEPFNSAPFEDLSQASLFDEKGMPRKEWGDIWKTLADILNIPKALRASGDLSAGGRQGWFLSIPPTRWHIAAKSFGKSLQASEAFGLKKGADRRLHAEMKQRSAYRDAVAAGLAVHSNDPLSVQTELFGSRLAGKIPWAKYSEQAYKTHLDWLSLMTFEVYKKSIDKQIKDPKERFEAYQAAADWINVSSGRGSYRGKFGAWYQRKAAPMLNIFGWAPGLVYSRFQLLNPYTYAQNLKNPGHRVVFRKQMSEVFQSAAVLYVTATLAKAGGALISTDPDDADFLKLRFGTTRYDVLAGLQQVARLSLRIGDYLRTKATTDTSTEEGQKKVRKASSEATTTLLRFGRTKLGPVPGFVWDWWNDWVKVTGERHAPGEFITSFKEGNKVKGFADLAEDPIVSQVLPLFWADMVAAYEQGWRANGNQGGLEHVAKVLPAGLGIGVQDYDRPEWKKETRKQLDKFDLDPQFPKHKTGEKEEAYQKRVKEHIADQEAAINRFSSSESVKDQPLTRQKELLKQEMSDDGRKRLEKLRPDDIEDDRAVRAWILLGRDRLKNEESYKSADEETQKKILQSYYSRMAPYKAQPANKVHGYQKPDFVDETVLKRKIREAIKAQQ